MKRQTQLSRIIRALKRNRRISRNYCVHSMYILRLSERIRELKKMGWQFKPRREKNDYIYMWSSNGQAAPERRAEIYQKYCQSIV